MSQRSRILWLIALAVVPLTMLDAARIWQNFQEDRALSRTERSRLVELTALSLKVFIDNNVAAAKAVSLHPALSSGAATPELMSYLQRVVESQPDWVGVGVVGGDGHSIFGTQGSPPVFLGDRPYFKEALATGRPALSSGIIGRVTGRLNVVIAVPFAIASGGQGVLVAPVPVAAFAERLLSRVRPPSVQLAVIDRQGQLIANSDRARGAKLEPMRSSPGAEAVLGGARGTLVASVQGQEMLVAHAPVDGYGWGVLAFESEAAALGAARRNLLESAVVLLVMLALIAALGWILGGRLARAYQREVQARAEVERALRTREEFLAAASHDLRNPLAAIRSSGDLLRASLQRSGSVAPDRLATCIQHIDAAARRMAAQIDAFLDIARLQSGAPLDLALEEVDLAAVVREVTGEAQLRTTLHRVSADLADSLVVRADPARLHRAIANLVDNAVKYSPHGGEVRLRLERSDDAREAIFTVADDGLGIPPGETGRVFERFQRGSNVVGRVPGTGIGLPGARQIVEQHGGSIEVHSRLGEGTVFIMRLPAVAPPGACSERRAA